MKPRKMKPKEIHAQDVNRAYRFYRDVFDFFRDENQTLIIDGEPIVFIEKNQVQEIEILVRDRQQELLAHLKNNLIDVISIEERFNNKVAVTINDSEGNLVVIEANRD